MFGHTLGSQPLVSAQKDKKNTSAKINWPWFLIMCPLFLIFSTIFRLGFPVFPSKSSPWPQLRPGPAAWLPRRMASVVIRYKGRAPQAAGRPRAILGWHLAFWASKMGFEHIWTIKKMGFEQSNMGVWTINKIWPFDYEIQWKLLWLVTMSWILLAYGKLMQPNIDNWTNDLNSCTKNERGVDQFPFDRGLKGQRGKENLGAGRIVAWDPASFRHIMVSIKYHFF